MEADQTTFVRWTDIELFHNVFQKVSKYQKYEQPTEHEGSYEIPPSTIRDILRFPVMYRGKVKLHGANGGVALEGSQIHAQSRNNLDGKTGLENIVFGSCEPFFRSLLDPSNAQGRWKMTIFGEYCGPKVQRDVALSKIPYDIFAVFAIDIGGQLIIEPEEILHLMTKNGAQRLPREVVILPWHTAELCFDFKDFKGSGCESSLEEIENMVNEIDQIDPWVKDHFGITGPGEGLVLFPVSLLEESPLVKEYKTVRKAMFRLFGFKAKGVTHRVVGTKTSTQLRPDIPVGVEEYVSLMCPEPRFEQGANEVGGYKLTKMKAFLDWIKADVQKEGKDELEASGLQWKDVQVSITRKASAWYSRKVKENGAAN